MPLTSQFTAVFQVVNALAHVALAQFLSNESGLHGADPLFSDDGVFGGLEGLGVIVVNTVECRCDGRFLALEERGFGSRHIDRGN